ncbi:MAG: rRNA maturation RNase YbeY [Acidobacteria bacterium]|nr:rRNA maturation RNase YbeY [Acidobacteriota bacterium]
MPIPAKSVSNKKPRNITETAEVEIINKQRRYKLARKQIVNLSHAVLNRTHQAPYSATITFIRDREMQALNRTYRNLDKPTDVLAFAYREGMSDNEPDHNPNFLGDVIISVETADRYANEQGIEFATEINWLVIHGLLHLAGYDHETDNGEMRRLERRLRKELLSSQ